MKRVCQRISAIAALPLLLAACGQGDSGNVMAPAGNLLSPEQVDAALGPELANGTNALEPSNATEAAEAIDSAEVVEEPIEPRAPPDPEPAPADEPEPAPADEPAEVEPAANGLEEE